MTSLLYPEPAFRPRERPGGDPPWRLAFAHATEEPQDWLTPAEHLLLQAVPSPERRADWCAGRAAAKRAVMDLLSISDPLSIVIATGTRGEPVAERSHDRQPLTIGLSLAHRDGRALAIAAGAGLRVGIDLERVDHIPEAHGRFFVTPRERASGLDLAPLWALKEAAWKALACGPRRPFTALELRFDERGHVRAAVMEGVEQPIECVLGRPWPRYVLAFCVAAEKVRS